MYHRDKRLIFPKTQTIIAQIMFGFFVPINFSGVGTIYANEFICSVNFGKRYIDRRVFWMVSLVSPSREQITWYK